MCDALPLSPPIYCHLGPRQTPICEARLPTFDRDYLYSDVQRPDWVIATLPYKGAPKLVKAIPPLALPLAPEVPDGAAS